MRILVTLFIGLLLLAAIPVTVVLVKQRQELRQKAAPATTLTFSPATINKNVGDTFSFDIVINSGENQVIITELHLTYDPAKLEAQSITNGPLFPRIYASGTVGGGTASITVGATDETHPITGNGTAAIIRFKALAPTGGTPISVRLTPTTTFVGGLGEGSNNLLVGSSPATITIGGSGPSTSPTLAPSPTIPATPTPSRAPSITPPPSHVASPSALPQSQQASPSATMQITRPVGDTSVSNKNIMIAGKAAPGATITLTIYSTPQTVIVTADENGNWHYTSTSLDPGPHNIVATATDTLGSTQTASTSFVVTGSGTATESAIPTSGTVETTIGILVIGLSFLLLGAAVPLFAQ